MQQQSPGTGRPPPTPTFPCTGNRPPRGLYCLQRKQPLLPELFPTKESRLETVLYKWKGTVVSGNNLGWEISLRVGTNGVWERMNTFYEAYDKFSIC